MIVEWYIFYMLSWNIYLIFIQGSRYKLYMSFFIFIFYRYLSVGEVSDRENELLAESILQLLQKLLGLDLSFSQKEYTRSYQNKGKTGKCGRLLQKVKKKLLKIMLGKYIGHVANVFAR